MRHESLRTITLRVGLPVQEICCPLYSQQSMEWYTRPLPMMKFL